MATTTQTGEFMRPRSPKTSQVLLGGAIIEGIGGLAGVVLSILGLAKIDPGYMAACAVIVIGISFVFEGGSVASRYSRLLRTTADEKADNAEIGGVATAEFLGGVTGIVLGFLALLSIVPATLTQVATIVYGATLLFSAGTTARLDSYEVVQPAHPRLQEAADGSVKVASGTQVLVGIGAMVLGILALVGIQPVTLPLVALLAVGASALLTGSAVGAKMAGTARAL